VCRLVVGGIFIFTGYPKLLRPDDVARLVYGYRILHVDMVNLVGITMPWLELVAGLFLVIGIIPRSSALVIAGMLGMFIGAGSLALMRGLEIECGCFFPFMGDSKLGWDLVVRDAILVLLMLQVLIWPSTFLPARRRAAVR
jgi:hypothetical protein